MPPFSSLLLLYNGYSSSPVWVSSRSCLGYLLVHFPPFMQIELGLTLPQWPYIMFLMIMSNRHGSCWGSGNSALMTLSIWSGLILSFSHIKMWACGSPLLYHSMQYFIHSFYEREMFMSYTVPVRKPFCRFRNFTTRRRVMKNSKSDSGSILYHFEFPKGQKPFRFLKILLRFSRPQKPIRCFWEYFPRPKSISKTRKSFRAGFSFSKKRIETSIGHCETN